MKIAHALNDPLIIPDEEYYHLRNEIQVAILTFFDTVFVKDAAENELYISFIGKKNHWVAVSVFHCADWYGYQQAELIHDRLLERLDLLQLQYDRTLPKLP